MRGSTRGERDLPDVRQIAVSRSFESSPFKLNQDRRHHIPRQRRKVTNWPAYEASLRQRGSLTVWFPTKQSRPGQRNCERRGAAKLGIRSALTLRAVFRFAYRMPDLGRPNYVRIV